MTERTFTKMAIVTLLLTSCMAFGFTGAVTGQETTENASSSAPMYEEQESEVDTGAWTADNEEPTLDAILTYVSRLGSFVVGTGTGEDIDQSTGPLLVGALLVGTVLGVVVGTGIGTVGGSALIVSGAYAAVGVGIAPTWSYAVVVFGVGLVLATVARRVMS